jgi:hypothetical protein
LKVLFRGFRGKTDRYHELPAPPPPELPPPELLLLELDEDELSPLLEELVNIEMVYSSALTFSQYMHL